MEDSKSKRKKSLMDPASEISDSVVNVIIEPFYGGSHKQVTIYKQEIIFSCWISYFKI